MRHLRAISLFSGVGMFDLGVSLAGFDIIAQVEIDEFCRRVLKRHGSEYWPNATQFMDVRQFGRESIGGGVDLIFGGFPCQPHSLAGSRKGADDNRNLWPEFYRIIGEIQPRAVLLENVPGITQASTVEGELRPAYALTVIADLAALGYVCRWGTISAADAGAPHVRDRWWCVAYTDGTRRKEHVKTGQRSHSAKAEGRLDNRLKRRSYVVNASRARREKRHASCVARQTAHATRRRDSHGRHRGAQSRLGGAAYGVAGGVEYPRWPAYQNQPQHAWEEPRTVDKQLSSHRRARLKALGNGGIWTIAYQLAVGIQAALNEC